MDLQEAFWGEPVRENLAFVEVDYVTHNHEDKNALLVWESVTNLVHL